MIGIYRYKKNAIFNDDGILLLKRKKEIRIDAVNIDRIEYTKPSYLIFYSQCLLG